MHFTKKIDRARQWAGEKMGGEAKTTHTDEFRTVEAEMNMRQTGMDRLSKAMTSYTRWLGRRCDSLEDKERAAPMAYFARSMATHGEEFDPDSEFGNSLVAVGQANERIAGLQDNLLEQANATWVDNLDRSLAMMKEYQASRKKLESRRLAYDASTAKLNKARRDDFRVEEEVRTCKAKFEESEEDVWRRMQDIKEAEADSAAALNEFLDAQLDFHERCADELRRARQTVGRGGAVGGNTVRSSPPRPRSARPPARSRSNTARSWQDRPSAVQEEYEPQPQPLPLRNRNASPSMRLPPAPPRPAPSRAQTTEPRLAPRSTTGPPPLPLTRVRTDGVAYGHRTDDIFADDDSTSGSGSPDYGDRSLSPATSYGSLGRSSGGKKAPPPPPPVNRAKKPAPPVPARKDFAY